MDQLGKRIKKKRKGFVLLDKEPFSQIRILPGFLSQFHRNKVSTFNFPICKPAVDSQTAECACQVGRTLQSGMTYARQKQILRITKRYNELMITI